ncbi:cell division cycle and apoptosis regulator protein 1 [Bemisia tabaci]|uniref:cell division cycle and apoptosis regulator protein 1 n=1 Tax=Bemisia tabaci TaxID=7038 RepID=UPI003B27BBE0
MSGFNQNPGMGGKNPPWARSTSNNVATNAINSAALSLYQHIAQASLQLQAGLQNNQLGYPQFSGGAQVNQDSNQSAAVGAFNPLNLVRYPTPATSAYQSTGSNTSNATTRSQPVQGNQNTSNTSQKAQNRVFTGTVTRKQDNFGFIDDDVFFRSTAVQGRDPSVGDTVLVEASYNDAMPFKWNATRVQAINSGRSGHTRFSDAAPVYNSSASNMNYSESRNQDSRGRDRRSRDRAVVNRRNDDRRSDNYVQSRDADQRTRDNRRSRHSPPEKEKSNRDARDRSRDKDRSRRSPVFSRSKTAPRYQVQVPRISLDMQDVDVMELHRRYPNMYIPSDFYLGEYRWVDQFPPLSPFELDHPCNFHIMKKDVSPVHKIDAVLEPPDLDYLYCAKVMLISMPSMEEIFRKCIVPTEDLEKDEYPSVAHASRQLNFLVGNKGKNEAMAIGGPWSPSLDGQNPDKDPSVLIRTAIRTCKALTGIDLSNCTQWYRFVEIHYQRGDTIHKGKHIPARTETVVLFLPDVWSCIPTQLEWDKIRSDYKKFVEKSVEPEKAAPAVSKVSPAPEVKQPSSPKTPDDEKETDQSMEVDSGTPAEKQDPTHYSQLDPKNMKVQHLKDELEARNLSSKGLKSQLTARLLKALKAEEEEAKKKEDEEKVTETPKEEEKKKESDSWTVVDSWSSVDDKSSSRGDKDEDKKDKEKLKASLEKKYSLPEFPHMIVYPSSIAKSGKFDCSLMSLSLLLDYRPDDNKEHLFEISLFAELFNEMLMRDFGFLIYHALLSAPNRSKEEDKKKNEEKKSSSVESERRDKEKEKEKDNDTEKDKSKEKDKDKEKEKEREKDKERERDREKEKKQEKVKYLTANKKLLLAFSYFDTSGCGYIMEKDLETLLFSLSLSFSRSQVKKLLSKVVKRDVLTYRKLTDKPVDEKIEEKEAVIDDNDPNLIEKIASQLAAGKKRKSLIVSDHCLKKSRSSSKEESNEDGESDFINYKGSLINVENITSQLKRSENARLETENALTKLKADFGDREKDLADSKERVRALQEECKKFTDQLAAVTTKCLSLSTENEKLTAAVLLVHNITKPFIIPQEGFLSSNETDLNLIAVKDIKKEAVESSNSA